MIGPGPWRPSIGGGGWLVGPAAAVKLVGDLPDRFITIMLQVIFNLEAIRYALYREPICSASAAQARAALLGRLHTVIGFFQSDPPAGNAAAHALRCVDGPGAGPPDRPTQA